MDVTFWMLATAVLILIYISGAVAVLYIRRNRKRVRVTQAELNMQYDDEPDPVVESFEPPEAESPYAASKDLLKHKYDSVKNFLKIPPYTAFVTRKTNVFCLNDCDIVHYCWASSSNLYFFPKWESIEAFLDAGKIADYAPGDENALLTLTIPKGSVGYWRSQPDGTVQLAYAPKLGKRAYLSLDLSAVPILSRFMPEKELTYVMKNVYPRSPQNIFDIGKEFSQLKRMWKNGRISDEEYDRNKKKILFTM